MPASSNNWWVNCLQIIEYNTLARDILVSVGELKGLSEALNITPYNSAVLVPICSNHMIFAHDLSYSL